MGDENRSEGTSRLMRALDFIRLSPQEIKNYILNNLDQKKYDELWKLDGKSMYSGFSDLTGLHGFTKGFDRLVRKKLPILYLGRCKIKIVYGGRLVDIIFIYHGGGIWNMEVEVQGKIDEGERII